MKINHKNYDTTLTAVQYCKSNTCKCGDVKKAYTTSQKSMTEFEMVVDKEINTNELFRAINKFISCDAKKFEINQLNIDVDSFLKLVAEDKKAIVVEIITNAVEYSTTIPYCVKQKAPKTVEVNLIIAKEFEAIVKEKEIVAQAQNLARRLQDMPSNEMVPGTFVKEIQKIYKEYGLDKTVEIKVINRAELEKMGMNLLVGVGQAAEAEDDQPRLVTITYKNDTKNPNDLTAFVGKGVCFDTGGLNIKTAGHMRWMKYDMSGVAIVAMTLLALAKNKVTGNFVAVCPLVINLCDTNGQRPDDIVKGYSGKTVEIDNTDAEGRLILADALTYTVKDLKASRIFDIATLTGAMIYSLGDTYTGVWVNNDELWNKINCSANKAGELVWRMPFHNDFLEMLKSSVADIANSVSDPRGGSSRAACFLKEFVEDTPYAHFDVASTATKNNLATGIMLNTFYNYAKNK